jgi:hypothetical protein
LGIPESGCGPCLDGVWTCNDDGSAVDCLGAGALNACEGCGELAHPPGEACGPCGLDETVCLGTELTVCDDEPPTWGNACEGCGELAHPPGEACGPCGLDETVCLGSEATVCDDEPPTWGNACEGCGELAHPPGEACGPCGLDAYVCLGSEATVCDDEPPTYGNLCGGCTVFPGGPGEHCGLCGETVCVDEETLVCDDPGLNACEGCGELEPSVGTPCGPCDLDEYVCAGPTSTDCDDDPPTYGNECLGCDPIDEPIGARCSCGGEGDGIWVCDGTDAAACDDGNNARDDAVDAGEHPDSTLRVEVGDFWIDGPPHPIDWDWFEAHVTDEPSSGLTPTVSIGVPSSSNTGRAQICVFYVYDDDRGADLGTYGCSYGASAIYDASQSCLSNIDCREPIVFDPSEDLMGCCSQSYGWLGWPDGLIYFGSATRMNGVGSSEDDTGTTYGLVRAVPPFSVEPRPCLGYTLYLGF